MEKMMHPGKFRRKKIKSSRFAQTIENSKEVFEEIEKEIEEAAEKREKLNHQHKAFLRRREKSLSKHMSDLDKEVFRLESRKEGYEETAEKQMNYMWEEYELTYNRALAT